MTLNWYSENIVMANFYLNQVARLFKLVPTMIIIMLIQGKVTTLIILKRRSLSVKSVTNKLKNHHTITCIK